MLKTLSRLSSMCVLSLFLLSNTTFGANAALGPVFDNPEGTDAKLEAGQTVFWVNGPVFDKVKSGDQIKIGAGQPSAAPGNDAREVSSVTLNQHGKTQIIIKQPTANAHNGASAHMTLRPHVAFGNEVGEAFSSKELKGSLKAGDTQFWLSGDQTSRISIGGYILISETTDFAGATAFKVALKSVENGRTLITLAEPINKNYEPAYVSKLNNLSPPEKSNLGVASASLFKYADITPGTNTLWFDSQLLDSVSIRDEITIGSGGKAEKRTIVSVGIFDNKTGIDVSEPFRFTHRDTEVVTDREVVSTSFIEFSRDPSSLGDQEYAPGSKDVVFMTVRVKADEPIIIDDMKIRIAQANGFDLNSDFNKAFANFRLYNNDKLVQDDVQFRDNSQEPSHLVFDRAFEIAGTSILKIVGDITTDVRTGDRVKLSFSTEDLAAEFISTGIEVPAQNRVGGAESSFVEVKQTQLTFTNEPLESGRVKAGTDDFGALEFQIQNSDTGDVDLVQFKLELNGTDAAAQYEEYTLSVFADGVQQGAAKTASPSGEVVLDDISTIIPSGGSKDFEIVMDTTDNVADRDSAGDFLRVSLVETQIKQIETGISLGFADKLTGPEFEFYTEGGGPIVHPTIGTCAVAYNGALQCRAQRPVEDPSDPDWITYYTCTQGENTPEECVQAWAETKGFTTCGPAGDIFAGVADINAMTQAETEAQCGPILPPLPPSGPMTISRADDIQDLSPLIAGVDDITALEIKIQNPNEINTTIKEMRFEFIATDAAEQFEEYAMAVFAEGVQQGSAVRPDFSGSAIVDDMNVIVAAGEEALFEIVIDTTENLANGDREVDSLQIALTQTSTEDVNNSTLVEGAKFTLIQSGGLNINNGPIIDNNSNVLVAGQVDADIWKLRFSAYDDDIEITDLYLRNTGTADAGRATFKLYDEAGNLISTESAVNQNITFELGNSSRIRVPKDGSVVITIKADINSINQVSQTGKTIQLELTETPTAPYSVEAVTAATGGPIADGKIDRGTSQSELFVAYRTSLAFANAAVQPVFSPGTVGADIYRFTVNNDIAYEALLNKISLEITTSKIGFLINDAPEDLQLIRYADASYSGAGEVINSAGENNKSAVAFDYLEAEIDGTAYFAVRSQSGYADDASSDEEFIVAQIVNFEELPETSTDNAIAGSDITWSDRANNGGVGPYHNGYELVTPSAAAGVRE